MTALHHLPHLLSLSAYPLRTLSQLPLLIMLLSHSGLLELSLFVFSNTLQYSTIFLFSSSFSVDLLIS